MARIGINISKALKGKLPPHEQETIEDALRAKTDGNCFLCGEPMNFASESIEADHDVPESLGGPTELANLNLAHAKCNRAKKANPSIEVKPFLRFSAFVQDNGGFVKYDTCITHFGISPKPSLLDPDGSTLRVTFANDSKDSTPIFTEELADGTSFEYCFLKVPREALYNDNECQPRTVKLNHVWSIYSDLHKNPLHEPPGCRIVPDKDGLSRILMFDGQHKTIANWMRGRSHIVVKIYFNIDQPQTTRLINSIQAKIKKLPLSPFELVAKLADEWANQLATYEEDVGSGEASEKGFMDWLPTQEERRNGKKAFRSALIQQVIDAEDLRMKRFVIPAGGAKADGIITEQVFKAKVLENLLRFEPLAERASFEGGAMRTREVSNIVHVLNTFSDLAFEPITVEDPEPADLIRVDMLKYQASLEQVARLIRALFRHHLVKDDDVAILTEPTEDQWSHIDTGIERIVEHPVWTTDKDASAVMREFYLAMSRNQEAKRACDKVGLDLGYLVTGELTVILDDQPTS